MLVVGLRSSSIAHVPTCSDVSIEQHFVGMPQRQAAGHVHRQRRLADAALVADERGDAALRDRRGGTGLAREQPVEHGAQLGGRQRPPEKVAHLRAQQLDDRGALRLPLLEPVGHEGAGDRRVRHLGLQILRQRRDLAGGAGRFR